MAGRNAPKPKRAGTSIVDRVKNHFKWIDDQRAKKAGTYSYDSGVDMVDKKAPKTSPKTGSSPARKAKMNAKAERLYNRATKPTTAPKTKPPTASKAKTPTQTSAAKPKKRVAAKKSSNAAWAAKEQASLKAAQRKRAAAKAAKKTPAKKKQAKSSYDRFMGN